MQTDLWPTTGVQFTSDEHAAILAGMVVKSAAGVPRAGVFPRGPGSLVTARPDMRVNVLPQELLHVKEGARFAALTETIDVVVPNAPAANSQYNIVCYVGSDQKLTGVASTSDFVVVAGTPSATPSDPALPDGAIAIARVAVPSTATATNSAGVVITPLHPFTAMAGGVVLFRSSAELTAWVAGAGQHAHDLATGDDYIRSVSGWTLVGGATVGTITAVAGPFTLSADSKLTKRGTRVDLNLLAARNAPITAGVVILTLPEGFRPAVTHVFPLALVSGASPGIGWLTVDPAGVISVGAYLTNTASLALRAEISFDV